MKKIIATLVFLCVALSCASAFAGANLTKKSGEVSLFGGYVWTNNKHYELLDDQVSPPGWAAGLNLGVFLIKHLELALNVAYGQRNGGNAQAANFDGQWKYLFFGEDSTLVPYLGAQVGDYYLYHEKQGTLFGTKWTDTASSNSLTYGGLGGVKLFLSKSVSLNVEYNYRRVAEKIKPFNQQSVIGGMSYFF